MTLVEPEDAKKTPIVGFFMNVEGGKALAGRAEKQRTGVYTEKEPVGRADEMMSYVGAHFRNEFVTEAVKFYIGFLDSKKTENYLLQSLSSVFTSTVHNSENRLTRMDFKPAVKISKLAHMIAYLHEIDEDVLKKLHLKCVDEVKKVNGAVESEDTYKYQKREVWSTRVAKTIYESYVWTTALVLFMIC